MLVLSEDFQSGAFGYILNDHMRANSFSRLYVGWKVAAAFQGIPGHSPAVSWYHQEESLPGISGICLNSISAPYYLGASC